MIPVTEPHRSWDTGVGAMAVSKNHMPFGLVPPGTRPGADVAPDRKAPLPGLRQAGHRVKLQDLVAGVGH
eukprot:4312701-Alexandrium_andersonii.AAC.1